MLEALRRRAGRFGLDLILINEWEGGEALTEAAHYCQMWGIDATVLLDETADYARALGVRGVPTNVFVDERGIVREVGASTITEMVAAACRLCPELAEVADELLAYSQNPMGFVDGEGGG